MSGHHERDTPGELSDAALARRIAEVSSPAHEAELCRRFGPRVRLFGIRRLGRDDAAADLAQHVLALTLVKLRAGDVREPDRIASFILGAARMAALEHRRREGRELELPEAAHEALVAAITPRDALAADLAARCLHALDDRARSVVIQTFYGERSSAEIAKSLGVQCTHVRVIRHRALQQLRACMGIEPEKELS